MAVGSAISSPLGPASCDKDAKALQFIEETTRNADMVQKRVSPEILARNANTEDLKRFNLNGTTDRDSFKSKRIMIPFTDDYEDLQRKIQPIANGDHSRFVLITGGSISNLLTSVKSVAAVSFTTRMKASISNAFHGVSTSIKALLEVWEPIDTARDFLLNRLLGAGGGGGGGEGGDEEEGDVEGRGGDKKKLGRTLEMLQLIATTTIANTAQTFGSAISLKVGGLTFLTKILLILIMASGLAGYLCSITAILLMHKRPRFSRVLVWTGCAATTLGFLILIVAFVLEL